MQERIRRASVLFRELGYELTEGEGSEDNYTGTFVAPDGFQGIYFIDVDSKFLEVAFTFSFSGGMADFVRERMEELVQGLYEFGCYFTLTTDSNEITYSVYSKIYYAGLNYFSLKETLRDFREAIGVQEEILEIPVEHEKGASDGDS